MKFLSIFFLTPELLARQIQNHKIVIVLDGRRTEEGGDAKKTVIL